MTQAVVLFNNGVVWQCDRSHHYDYFDSCRSFVFRSTSPTGSYLYHAADVKHSTCDVVNPFCMRLGLYPLC